MFLEIQSGIARNVYLGEVAPAVPVDGSIVFVAVDTYADAVARIGMAYADGVFTETDESRQLAAPSTPAIAPLPLEDKLDQILAHLTATKEP